MIGPRQVEILTLLQTGPHSLDALIARLDPGHPERVNDSVKRLIVAGLVEETGRRSSRRTAGAMVALVEPGAHVSAPAPTGRAVGSELAAMADRMR